MRRKQVLDLRVLSGSKAYIFRLLGHREVFYRAGRLVSSHTFIEFPIPGWRGAGTVAPPENSGVGGGVIYIFLKESFIIGKIRFRVSKHVNIF